MANLYDSNNVVVGRATLWYAPYLPALPTPLVADSVALFATYPAPWTGIGATEEGFKVNVDTSTQTHMIEEQSSPVTETVESRTISIDANLVEDRLATMRLTWGGSTLVVTAPATGVAGKSSMTLTDNLQFYTVILEAANFTGLARRIYIPKASFVGSGETAFRRSSSKRMYPIKITSLSAPSEIQVVDITAPAL